MNRDEKSESGAVKLGLTAQNVQMRRYDERDIATLESGDLTDSMVEIALGVAYEQNDTEARKLHVVLQRNPGEAAHGSAEVLASRLGEIERKLKGRPKNAFLRTQRAAILCSLARRDAASVRRARGRAAAIAP